MFFYEPHENVQAIGEAFSSSERTPSSVLKNSSFAFFFRD
jgi:hypothetical protein